MAGERRVRVVEVRQDDRRVHEAVLAVVDPHAEAEARIEVAERGAALEPRLEIALPLQNEVLEGGPLVVGRARRDGGVQLLLGGGPAHCSTCVANEAASMPVNAHRTGAGRPGSADW
jgi:hypothetical protein